MIEEKYMNGMPLNSVKWYVPHRNRPLAHSTVLIRNVIWALAEDCDKVRAVKDRMRLNQDVVRVIDAYIKAGYGDSDTSILFQTR